MSPTVETDGWDGDREQFIDSVTKAGLKAYLDPDTSGVLVDMPDGSKVIARWGEDDTASPEGVVLYENYGTENEFPTECADTKDAVEQVTEMFTDRNVHERTLPEEQELEDVVIDAADLEVARVRAYSPWEPSKQAGLSMSDLKMIGEGKLKVKPQARQTDYKQDREVGEAQKASSPEVEDLKELMGAMKLFKSDEGDVM